MKKDLLDKKRMMASEAFTTEMFVGWLNNDQLPSVLLGPVTIKTIQKST